MGTNWINWLVLVLFVWMQGAKGITENISFQNETSSRNRKYV